MSRMDPQVGSCPVYCAVMGEPAMKRIAQGPIVQTSWVVPELDPALAQWSDLFGVVGWTVIRDVVFPAEACWLHGEPTEVAMDVAMTYSGDMQLELIAPRSQRSLYTEFLAERGPGMHHVCFEIDDMATVRAAAVAAGIHVAMNGVGMDGELEFAYLSLEAAGAPYVELTTVGPALREVFAQVRATAEQAQLRQRSRGQAS